MTGVGLIVGASLMLSGCAFLPDEDGIVGAEGVQSGDIIGTWLGARHQKLVLREDGTFATNNLQAVDVNLTDKYGATYRVGKRNGTIVLWTATGDLDDPDSPVLKKS